MVSHAHVLPFRAQHAVIPMDIPDPAIAAFLRRQFSPVKYETGNLIILLRLIPQRFPVSSTHRLRNRCLPGGSARHTHKPYPRRRHCHKVGGYPVIAVAVFTAHAVSVLQRTGSYGIRILLEPSAPCFAGTQSQYKLLIMFNCLFSINDL